MRVRLASVVACFLFACGGEDPPPFVPYDAPPVGGDPDAPVGGDPDAPVGGDPDAAVVPPEPDASMPLACGGGTASFIALDSTVTGSTAGASNTTNGSCGGASAGEAIFYFTLTTEADVVVSTDLPGTDYNTAVYVRSTCDDMSTQIGCAGGSPLGDAIALGLIPAGTYYVFVDGVAGSTGNYELSVTTRPVLPEGSPCDPTGVANTCETGTVCVGTPPVCTSEASLCEDTAVVITPGTTYNGTTIGSSNNYGPGCSTDGSAPEVVHRVDVPAGNWDLLASSTPTNFGVDGFDVILTVESSCGDASTTLDCQDSPGASSTESVSVNDIAPGTYWILVDGYMDTMGDYSLDVTLRPVLAAGATCDVSGTASRCMTGLICLDDGMGGGPVCTDPAATACASATAAAPSVTGTIPSGTSDLAASCGSSGNEVLYYVDVLDGQYIGVVESGATTGRVIYVTGPDTCNPDVAELGCDGGGTRGVTTGTLTAGRYYVVVDGTGSYTLNIGAHTPIAPGGTCALDGEPDVDARCAAGAFCLDGVCTAATTTADVAPNAAFCDAQGPFTTDLVVDGTITGGTDFDNFELTLTAASTDLVIETSDGFGCSVNTVIEFYSAGLLDCMTMDLTDPAPTATNDNSGPEMQCSYLVQNDLPAGTYYVLVRRAAGSTTTGPYFLTVDFQ